jgi:hypothetical protein
MSTTGPTTATPPATTGSFIKELEAGALQFIGAELAANQAAFTNDVALIESDVKAGLVNLLKNIPSVGGIAGLAVGPIEAMIESGLENYADTLIAKYGPTVLYAAAQALIAKLAAEV